MKTLPKIVKFIKYHWRHCAVFVLTPQSKFPTETLFQHSVSMGWHHSPTGPSPEEACKAWLKEHGYTFEAEEPNCRERWVLTTA